MSDEHDHVHGTVHGQGPTHPRQPDVEDIPTGESQRLEVAVR